MKQFKRLKKEQSTDGSFTSVGAVKTLVHKLTGGMTPFEKKAFYVIAAIAGIAVIYCFAVTSGVLYALCLFASFATLFALILLICGLSAKRGTYKSKTWALYFLAMLAAATYIIGIFTYDFNADPVNLMLSAKKIRTYDEAVAASEKNYTNTLMELDEYSLILTDYSYGTSYYEGDTEKSSKTLYSYYLLYYKGKYVICRADPGYLKTYFEQKNTSGSSFTRVYLSKIDYADAGFYDLAFSPTILIYPGEGDGDEYEAQSQSENTSAEEDVPDYDERLYEVYLKHYSDLPLYTLEKDFVVTLKDYDIDLQRTVFLGMVVFWISILTAAVTAVMRKRKE